MSLSLAGISAILGPLGNILNKIIPDPNERERIKADLTKEMLNADGEFYKAAGSIITAEAKGESWMQRNWRPITMLTFVVIIANNYILVPYIGAIASWFGASSTLPMLPLPDGLWTLLQIGIGGYIASRGGEKIVESIQEGGIPMIGSSRATTRAVEELRTEQQRVRGLNEELLAELRRAGN